MHKSGTVFLQKTNLLNKYMKYRKMDKSLSIKVNKYFEYLYFEELENNE